MRLEVAGAEVLSSCAHTMHKVDDDGGGTVDSSRH